MQRVWLLSSFSDFRIATTVTNLLGSSCVALLVRGVRALRVNALVFDRCVAMRHVTQPWGNRLFTLES